MQNKIKNWILTISKNENIPKDIQAINIGLFESEKGYMLYMIGSKKYSSEDSDWACEEDFIPKQKYFLVDDDNFNKMSWENFLNEIVKILKNFIKSDYYNTSIFYFISHITTGFDDGDLKIIK